VEQVNYFSTKSGSATESRLQSRVVRILIKQGDAGVLFATSPDLQGLFVAETSLEALEAAIPIAITDMYAVCGENVLVLPVEGCDDEGATRSWVKVPAEVAQTALEKMAERCAN
jgi:acyl-CoA synthetase (NDP forming)